MKFSALTTLVDMKIYTFTLEVTSKRKSIMVPKQQKLRAKGMNYFELRTSRAAPGEFKCTSLRLVMTSL